MRILVPVKHVPDLQSQRSFTEGTVTRTAEDSTMNELDEHAVEAAMQLVEAAGEGEVIALTVGGPDAESALRKALQLGATTAIHVSDVEMAGSDVFGTAKVLAAAVSKIHGDTPLDMVITGMAALDGLTSMIPTALAASLEWPQLTLASELAAANGSATVVQHLSDAHVTLTAPLPVVVSVTDELNKPRFPNFKLIMAARKAEVTLYSLSDIGVDPAEVGASAARVAVIASALRPPRADTSVVTDTGEGGARLAEFLIERGLA